MSSGADIWHFSALNSLAKWFHLTTNWPGSIILSSPRFGTTMWAE